jgi:hypothetical protein
MDGCQLLAPTNGFEDLTGRTASGQLSGTAKQSGPEAQLPNCRPFVQNVR